MNADLVNRLDLLDAKLDTLIRSVEARPDQQRYLTAKDVQRMTGLDQRTILNRSNLPTEDARHIPSLRLGARRKYFERKVIDRLFRLDAGCTGGARPSGR